MKYIVTGATGHVGGNIVRYLLGKNQEVKIAVRNINDKSIKDLDCEKVIGDLNSEEFINSLIEDNSIVIHSAGIIDLTNKMLDQMMKVNVEATMTIVQACAKHNAKLIYIGSTDALPLVKGEVSEPMEFALEGLDNYYAITKAMASDYVLKALNSGLIKGTIVCPSAVLGINDFKVSTQGGVIKNQINKKVGFNIKGHYNFVDVECIAEGVYNASIKEDLKPVYLFTGVDVSMKEMYLSIFKATNKKPHMLWIPMCLARFAALFTPLISKITKKKPVLTKMSLDTISNKMYFNNSLAKKDLDYKDTDFDNLVLKTINWFQAQDK